MKQCIICGCQFKPRTHNQLTCSPECSRENKRQMNHISRSGCRFSRRFFKPQVPRTDKTLEEWQHEAQQCGISYGKYRAAINQGKTFEELKNYYESNRN